LDGCLPAGREDVAEKQHLLVAQAIGNLYVRLVGERHADVFGLAAWVPTRACIGRIRRK
jgi:hypothetical protein